MKLSNVEVLEILGIETMDELVQSEIEDQVSYCNDMSLTQLIAYKQRLVNLKSTSFEDPNWMPYWIGCKTLITIVDSVLKYKESKQA